MVHQPVKPSVSEEEVAFRKKSFRDVTTVVDCNARCTSCSNSVKDLVFNKKPVLHPFLDTLQCEKCHYFFGDGEFSVDEDGSDKYCRWCGQGGSLYLCSTCTAGFCKKCIKRNLPRSLLKDVEADDWECFCCNVEPLFDLRSIAWAAVQHSCKQTKKVKKIKYDSDEDYMKPKKTRKRKIKETLTAERKTVQSVLYKYHQYLAMIENMCEVTRKKCIDVKSKGMLNGVDDPLTEDFVQHLHSKIKGIFDHTEQSLIDLSEKMENYNAEWKITLEKSREEDRENKVKIVVNGGSKKGESKKSESGDEESDAGTKNKRKVSSKKPTVDTDVESEEEVERKSRNSSKGSDRVPQRDSKSDTPMRSRRISFKDSIIMDSDSESAHDTDEDDTAVKARNRSRKSMKEIDDSDEELAPTSKKKDSLRESRSRLPKRRGSLNKSSDSDSESSVISKKKSKDSNNKFVKRSRMRMS